SRSVAKARMRSEFRMDERIDAVVVPRCALAATARSNGSAGMGPVQVSDLLLTRSWPRSTRAAIAVAVTRSGPPAREAHWETGGVPAYGVDTCVARRRATARRTAP